MGFLFMYNAITSTWKRRETGARAEADLKQCSLSRWFVHPDGEGKKMRCKWKKKKHRVGGTVEVIVVGVSAGRCWSPCVWKCKCTNVFLTPRNCMFLQRYVGCHMHWAVGVWFPDILYLKLCPQSFPEGCPGNCYRPPLHSSSTSVWAHHSVLII